MTRPGYRKTSPPQVFIDFSREAIESIAGGNFTQYNDPFDLKNTMKSFSYTLTKGDVPGRMDLQLINPSQQVEQKLFSWFAAINPRTWRAKQDAPEGGNTGEYWASLARNQVKCFVRWGYISDPEDYNSPSTALSHIHEMLIFDVGYEVSDKQDRIVTVQMQTQHDITLLRQADQSAKSLNQTIKASIETDQLAGQDGVPRPELREPADIVSELISRLASGDGAVGGCMMSQEQRQKINEKFDVLGGRLLPSREDIDHLQNSEFDPDTEAGKLMGYNTVMRFFNGLGVDVHVVIGGDLPPTPQRSLSPSQAPGTGNYRVSPTPLNDLTNAQETNYFFGPIEINTPAIDQKRTGPYEPGPIGAALLINPFKGEVDAPPQLGGPPSLSPYDPAEPAAVYPDTFTYEDLQRCLTNDKVYLLPKDRAPFYGGGTANTAWMNDALLAVSEFVNIDPTGELRGDSYVYKPSEHPEIKAVIELLIQNHQKELEEIKREQDLANAQQDIQQDQQTLNDNPLPTSDALPETLDKSYVSLTTPHRTLTLKKFLDKLNTTFFTDEADYIEFTHIPTSLIDKKDRKAFENALGLPELEWDTETGVSVAGTLGYINTLLAFAGSIDSFDIQIPDKPERIILSTGFSKNKTNIVTDVSYRQSRTGWFFEFLQSPIVMQQVYSIAERFENPEYRDAVWQYIYLQMDTDNTCQILEIYPEGDTERETPLRAFPEEVANKAFAAALRAVSDGDFVEDVAGTTDPEFQRLVKQVSEDLNFLKENELIEAFFPKATKGMLGSQESRAFIGFTLDWTGFDVPEGPLATELLDTKTFRFLANSPLQTLKAQENLEGAIETGYAPSLLAQKMRVLQAFKKRILNVRLRTLGIPELDVYSYELNKRRVGLIVSEPRVPGTYHWLTGMYRPFDVTHRISPEEGYVTEIELLVSDSNTQEEMLEVSFTFLEGNDA